MPDASSKNASKEEVSLATDVESQNWQNGMRNIWIVMYWFFLKKSGIQSVIGRVILK